jgi:plastocyanin
MSLQHNAATVQSKEGRVMIKKRLRIGTAIAASLMLVFSLGACGGGGGGGGTPPASNVVVTACTGTISATVDAVGTSGFSPAVVAIGVNDVVRWNNATVNDHTVTSTTVPANGTFNAALNNGTSVCLKFTDVGVFNYKCSIHPNMTGVVNVGVAVPAPTVVETACTGTISAVVSALNNTGYAPSAVIIAPNQVVRWDNLTLFNHTVTSTTVPANGTFDAALNNGNSVCLKFTEIGVFNYRCTPHSAMTGTVTVTSTPPPSSTPATVQVTACTGTISAVVSALSNTGYAPSAVTITANQVVQWNNASVFPHTVTSTTVPAGGTFNVALNNGTSVCLKFTAVGAFNYQCSIHPAMTGLVTVNP